MAVIGVKSITGITSITNAAGGADVLTFHSNNTTERLRIKSDGKIGIGIANPGGKLHINGIGSGDIVAELDSGSPTFTYRNGSGAWFHAGKHPSQDAFIIADGANTTTNERFRITSAGRVGIGTDAPADDPLTLYDADNNVGMYFQCPATGNANNNGFRIGRNQTHAFIWNYVNQPLALATQGQERLTILGNGNVGIGTEIPGAEFEVRGTGTVALFQGTGGNAFIGLTDVDAGAGIGYIGSDGGALLFQTPGSSYSTKLQITSSGMVLIGETSVAGGSQKLVIGQGGAENFEFTPGASAQNGGVLEYIHRGDGSTRPDLSMYVAGGAFKVYTGGNYERLRIDSSGRIQMGSDPSNLGAAKFNIVTGGDDGISLGRVQGASVSSGDVLGTLAFQCAVGSQTTNSAEASIKAIAEENSTGSTAATGLYFYTKQSGTGPGSSPAEAFHINAQGMTCHTSTPTAKVYAFAYPLGTGGSTTTTTIATITNPTSSCLAVATINWSSSYGASGSTRSSGQFVCGVRRSQSGSAWSASTSEVGPAGDTSYSVDCVWNGQTLQVTRGAWLNFVIDVRICVYNGTITNNLI